MPLTVTTLPVKKCSGNDRSHFQNTNINIKISAENGQSATATTAACGRNREELLGPRPARCECRPRHEAAAGSRNPNISAENFFDIADQPGLRAWLICFFTKGARKENSICLRRLSAGAAVWKEEADIKWSQSRSPRLQFAAGGFCFSMKRGSS